MIYGLLGILLISLVFAPSLWVRYVMRKYSTDRSDIPGSGGELARHLLQRFNMPETTVEETRAGGDHYDPLTNCVRLSPGNFQGRSLTAVAVAAHEVGHALQFHRQEPVSKLWNQYMPWANRLKRIGALLFMLAPLATALVHAPAAALIPAAIAIISLLASVISYLFVLPMEWDASFGKALPILSAGDYIDEQHLPVIRRVLKAAAFTYLAVALMDIIRLWRWGRMLRPL